MKNCFRIFLFLPFVLFAQDDLLAEIEPDSTPTFVEAAFKGLKIVNFESTELNGKNQLTFVVAHRFGSIENGFETFFGLDDAVTTLQLVYGINDGLNVSVARSSYQKIYDVSIKYRLFRQVKNGFPVTIVGFNSILVNSALDEDNLPDLEFQHRLGYTMQILVSRKFTENLSIELAPTFFHENMVVNQNQHNSQYALGIGGRYKLTKRFSLNADYGYHLNRAENSIYRNPLSIGVDIETGGHVFQLHFTNAQPMTTNQFLSEATGDWSKGEIFFGFNLSRYF